MQALAPPLFPTQWDRNKAGWEALKPRLYARWPRGWGAGRLGSVIRTGADKWGPRCLAESWAGVQVLACGGEWGMEQQRVTERLWRGGPRHLVGGSGIESPLLMTTGTSRLARSPLPLVLRILWSSWGYKPSKGAVTFCPVVGLRVIFPLPAPISWNPHAP